MGFFPGKVAVCLLIFFSACGRFGFEEGLDASTGADGGMDAEDGGDVYVSPLAPGETIRVSMGPEGQEANGHSNGHTVGISAQGRFVVFTSEATNLVGGDTNGVVDVFVADLLDASLQRVSVASDGSQGNLPSDGSSMGAAVSGIGISDDGYSVVFISQASNLVPADTNDTVDVFVFDRRSLETRRVSVDSTGNEGNGDCQRALINSDGRYVVFQSSADNLVTGDDNGVDDCFVHDLQTGQTRLVSRHSDGSLGNAACNHPRISSDGMLIAFTSAATNLIDDDSNGVMDSFVHDLGTGATFSVSRRQSDGQQCDAHSWTANHSGDQNFIAYHGFSTNLLSVGSQDDLVEDVFQYRVSDGFIRLVSESEHATALPADDRCYVSRQSESGRFVSFNSLATNLLDGQLVDNGFMDVFVKDMENGQVFWASRASDGGTGNGRSDRAYISRDGSHVAFESEASNLVIGDDNGFTDIFVHRFR